MIADAPSGAALFPQTSKTMFDELQQIGSGDYQYYRMSNGWIDFSQIGKGRTREASHILEGWTPLGGPTARAQGRPDYGVLDLHEYYLEHQFEVLFMRGGACEMPVEQVVALGYHLRPPLVPRCGLQVGAEHMKASQTKGHLAVCWRGAKPVHFPQLDGQVFADPGGCPFCSREDFATAAARNQHIRVLHREELNQMSLADAIVKGVQAANGATREGPSDVALPDEAEIKRRAAREQAELDAKLKAMGLLEAEAEPDDEADALTDELLAASVADDEPEPEGPAAPKRSHRRRAE